MINEEGLKAWPAILGWCAEYCAWGDSFDGNGFGDSFNISKVYSTKVYQTEKKYEDNSEYL